MSSFLVVGTVTMQTKTILRATAAAAAIALAPVVASASTVTGDLLDGDTTNVTFGVNSPFNFQGGVTNIVGGATGSFTHTFTVSPSGFGGAAASVDSFNAERFVSVTISWLTGGASETISGAGLIGATVLTTFSPSDTLKIEWQTVDGASLAALSFGGTITAIPVPAAGWLLLTALGGLGVMARRRKHAAA